MNAWRRSAVALALASLAACAAAPARAATAVRFVAFGDQPYGSELAVGPAYRELLSRIDAAGAAFAIHVGDFKDGGATRCTDEEFARQLAYFRSMKTALVYTPGDNDWYDCRRQGDDPLERLAALRRLFFAESRSLGRTPIALERQTDSMPAHPAAVENRRWQVDEVLFVTLHTVGPDDGFDSDSAALRADARARRAAARAWLADTFALARARGCRALVLATQADPFDAWPTARHQRIRPAFESLYRDTLIPLAQAAGIPVLLVHGDSHRYIADRPFIDRDGRTIAPLWRLEVPGAQRMHAVRVTIDPAAQPPFRFEPIWNPLSPDPRP